MRQASSRTVPAISNNYKNASEWAEKNPESLAARRIQVEAGEPDILLFAAITYEPPAEVAAAGHDQCIVPIKPTHIDKWLDPAGRHAQHLLDIVEDRERPYYEHRMAA